jgi:hypothetical protein
MVFSVDFHMRDELGRVPALVEGSALYSLHPGDLVLAEDDEGNRCKATVEEISPPKSTVYLALVPGTTDPSPKAQLIAETLNDEQESGQVTAFDRFEKMTRRLLSVSKKDVT